MERIIINESERDEIINQYERNVIAVMNEEGIQTIEEYIENFINCLEFNLMYDTSAQDELKAKHNTDDIQAYLKAVKELLVSYEMEF